MVYGPSYEHKEWETHFAWWPVRIATGEIAWLRTVRRRATNKTEFTTASFLFGGVADTVWYWEYDDINNTSGR